MAQDGRDARDYDAQEALRRQQLAIELSRYLPYFLITGAVLLGAIWMALPAYVQFAWYSALLLANAAVIRVSGHLYRRGRPTLAGALFAGSFTLHASVVPLFVKETLLEMTTGFMLVALLGGMVLGARRVAWVGVLAVPALVTSVVYGPTFQAAYVTPLPAALSAAVSTLLMAFQMLIDLGVLTLVLATQERLYREAKVAAHEAEALRGRVEDALAQSTAVLQNIADGLMAVDADGRVQATNPALVRILGLARDPADDVPPPLAPLVQRIRETGAVVREQLELPGQRVCAAVASPILAGEGAASRVVGSVVVVRDITAEKESERVRSQFLANMSHEIRTPMNAVVGMTELLQRTELSGRQQRYVDVIASCGESLLALINDILDLSKIEAGRFQLVDQDFDLPDVTERTTAMLARQGQMKGLAVTCRVDPSVPRAVRGDPERLRQILINLIGNAIKFTDRGGVSVDARLESAGDEHHVVRFEVRDTGIGIAAEHQAHLFDMFTQVDPSSTRSHGGTGLGTTIAKQLTELMGGRIGVSSALGVGSAFWFTARFARASTLEERPPAPGLAAGLRVLVVDRNAAERELLEAYLAAWGMEVVSVPSAAEAEAALEAQPFRVVLVSADLGDQPAAVLAARIRARWPVALVALGDPDDEVGFDAQVSKPVRQSALLDCLMGLLAGRRSSDPVASPGRPAAGRDRLLLAEDNPINQELAVEMLEEIGYRVAVVDTGRAAVDALVSDDGFAAVLMDCQMPVMDGYEAAREIRRRWPARRLPIIALTAHAMKEDRDRAIEAGMDDYLTKPVTFALLREALARWAGLGAESTAAPSPPDEPSPADLPASLAARPNVLRLLVKHVPNQLDAIRAALDGREAQAVERAAHSLKGALLMCGLADLGERCRQVELTARDGDVDAARLLVDRLAGEVAALVEAARARVGPAG